MLIINNISEDLAAVKNREGQVLFLPYPIPDLFNLLIIRYLDLLGQKVRYNTINHIGRKRIISMNNTNTNNKVKGIKKTGARPVLLTLLPQYIEYQRFKGASYGVRQKRCLTSIF